MNLLKKITVLVFILTIIAFGSGCSDKEDQPNIDQQPKLESTKGFTFVDSLGRVVTVENPQRVAAVGNFAQVWQLAGGELYAVTQDAYEKEDLQLSESVINLGDIESPSLEDIIASQADFVILSSKIAEHVALRKSLESVGIACAYFEVEEFEDYLNVLKTLTEITGNSELYKKNGLDIQSKIEQTILSVEGNDSPKVLFIRAFSTGITSEGSDKMSGIMLKDLGCTNIADSKESLMVDLSIEKIIEANPDFIFIVTMGESGEDTLEKLQADIMAKPEWGEITAVQKDRFIVLPKNLFHDKPNAMWAESYKMLADILYGEN